MNKAKTVEYLRGMKFMQRKEEAKRRERYDLQLRQDVMSAESLKHGDTTEQSSSSSGPFVKVSASSGPTIIRDTGVSPSHYRFSRQSFLIHEAPSATEQAVGEDEGVEGKSTNRKRARKELLPDQVWGEEDHEGDDDDDYDDVEEDPTAVGSSGNSYKKKKAEEGEDVSQGRFFLSESSRAPKLPRKLEEQMRRRGV